MTIRFYSRSKNSKIEIMCCISHEGAERHLSMGYSLPEQRYWDKAKKRSKGHDLSSDINVKIMRWEADFEAYVAKCKRGESTYDLLDALAAVRGGHVIKKQYLLECAREFVAQQKAVTKRNTFKQYETMVEDLQGYEAHARTRIRLTDVTNDFYRNYGLFLIGERGNINSTVNKKISRVIAVMNWAFKKELISTQRYADRFNFKRHPAKRFPLLPDEYEILHKYRPVDDWQSLILRAFLFCCETGLRGSDAKQLQGHHIRSHEGIHYLDMTEIKTVDRSSPPLSRRALELLKQCPQDGYLFRFAYSQSANRALKEIAKDAGLDRPVEIVQSKGADTTREAKPLHAVISFHFARNTYITNLLAGGLAPVFVQDNAGHSDLKTTMGYSKQDDMARWRETLRVQDRASQIKKRKNN